MILLQAMKEQFGSGSSLNEVFSTIATRRRYEVWFLRIGLADGSGAWWFRYLLMNLGRDGCRGNPSTLPAQVWATWFPKAGSPQTFVQEFSLKDLQLSEKGQRPFYFRVGDNSVEQHSCRGNISVGGHRITWEIRYSSRYSVTLSSKGWIGFSRTPHSDARFSGKIRFDHQTFEGDPLGFGVQGHNCGYRHRKFWTWTHAYFRLPAEPPTILEALIYEMPLGFVFRKAVLWHEGKEHVFRDLREISDVRKTFRWDFRCIARDGFGLDATIDGTGPNLHRLPYKSTDCKGSFEVTNNSLARAALSIKRPDGRIDSLETTDGAVLEGAGT